MGFDQEWREAGTLTNSEPGGSRFMMPEPRPIGRYNNSRRLLTGNIEAWRAHCRDLAGLRSKPVPAAAIREAAGGEHDLDPQALELAALLARVRQPHVRRRIVRMIRAMAATGTHGS